MSPKHPLPAHISDFKKDSDSLCTVFLQHSNNILVKTQEKEEEGKKGTSPK